MELYIYWHLPPGRAAAAAEAVAAFQRRWAARGIDGRLLRRHDGETSRATLMEIYRPVSPAAEPQLEALLAEAERLLAPHADGPRHVERFRPWPEPQA